MQAQKTTINNINKHAKNTFNWTKTPTTVPHGMQSVDMLYRVTRNQ